MQRIPILVFVFFCFTSVISAQSIAESDFINFNQSSGLPSNEAYYILKDSKQQLWISTDQGVVKFNGKNFEKIELPDKVVFKIKEDFKGNIWFFTQSGNLYYSASNKIKIYPYNDTIKKYIKRSLTIDAFIDLNAKIYINNVITSASYNIDKYGILKQTGISIDSLSYYNTFYIDRLNNGIYSYIPNMLSPNRFSIKIKFNGLLNDTAYIIPVENIASNRLSAHEFNGFIYFYWSNMLIKFNKNGGYTIKKFDKSIISINYDENHSLLHVGLLKGGVHFLDNNFKEIKTIFPDKSISSIAFDNEKGLWYSTLENGIYYHKNKVINKIDLINNKLAFRTYNFNDSLLYFANSEGVFSFNNNQIKNILKYNFSNVYDIIIKNKMILLSSFSDYIGHKFFKIRNYPLLKSAIIFTSSYEIDTLKNDQYVVSLASALQYFTLKSPKNTNDLFKFYHQTELQNLPNIGNVFVINSNIWLTSKVGLLKMDSLSNELHYIQKHNKLFELGTTYIRQLSNGYIITGLRFNGIAILDNEKIVGYINEDNGLINNSVKSIFVDKNNCWVSTANGLSVIKFSSYNPLKYTIINLGKSKGINNLLIYQINKFKNDILLTTNEGIQQIKNADSIINLPKDSLPFSIASIKYFGGDTSLINSLQAPYNKNSIAFTLNAICYNAADEVAYYYKINDVDTIWNKINTNELVLENLAPGIYDISFKAEVKSDNRYSEIIHFKFTVNKPWWDLTIVKIMGLLLLVFFISLFYRIRLFRIRKKDKEKAALKLKMSELEQTALRSQINPHFIFNCLTSIQHLIILNNSREANDYLVKFARLIRATLDISSKPTVVLKTEIDYLNDYVSLENLRTLTKVNLKFSVDPLINQNTFEFPSMILQPLIENAIRHGFNESVSDGTIEIKIFIKKNYIECQVQDDGVGYDISKINQRHKSFAMQNIIQRIRTLSNVGQPKVDDVLDIINLRTLNSNLKGTLVTLRIPLLNQTSTI